MGRGRLVPRPAGRRIISRRPLYPRTTFAVENLGYIASVGLGHPATNHHPEPRAVIGLRRNLQAIGQCFPLYDQAVIARYIEPLRCPIEQAGIVVADGA